MSLVLQARRRVGTVSSGALLSLVVLLLTSSGSFAYNDRADSLDKQAGDSLEKGDKKRAEALFLQALKVGETEGFGFSPNSADHLAKMYVEQKRFAEAEQMYLRSKPITARDFSNDLRLEMQIDVELATIYLQTGQTEKALVTVRRAYRDWLKVAAKKDEPSSDITFALVGQLARLATLLSGAGRNEDAEFCARAASHIPDRMEDARYFPFERTKYKCLLGKIYCKSKKFKPAIDILSSCIGERQEKFKLIDWELAEPTHYLVIALKSSNQGARAKALERELSTNWPVYAFKKSDEWAEKFSQGLVGRDSHNSVDLDAAAEAVRLARKWGAIDIRYADSEARLAILLHNEGKYNGAPAHFGEAIRLLKSSLPTNKPAIAARLEHWGKLVEDTQYYTRSAPWPVYREALAIRLPITKYKDEAAFRGAKQIANYCKNSLSRTCEEELFGIYADACNVMQKSRGLADPTVLDALHDLIAVRKKRYQYSREAAAHAPTIALYELALNGEKDAYGPSSPETLDTAKDLVAYLRRVQMNELASKYARQFAIK